MSDFDPQKLKADAMVHIKEMQAGNLPLFKAFWLYYFTPIFVLQVVGAMFGVVGIVFSLAALAWAGYNIMPLWKIADKYTGPAHWTLLAKIFSALMILSIVMTIINRLMYSF